MIPGLAELPDNAWAWHGLKLEGRYRVAAQYALWLSDNNDREHNLRWAIACMALPFLLTPHLHGYIQTQWVRLMGKEAKPLQDPTIMELKGIRSRDAWRKAFNALITSGQMQEIGNGKLVRGVFFSSSPLRANSHHAQRATFVMKAIGERAGIVWEELA